MPYNSTIIAKKKKLSCGHTDYNFSRGRCKSCATIQDTQKRVEKAREQEKQNTTLPKSFEPTKEEINIQNNRITATKITERGESEIWDWFLDRRKEMTGICKNCGEETSKNDDKYFHYSICHILEKSNFPSVATNENNFIELCYFGNSCHSNMDHKKLTVQDMNCFEEIIDKVKKMYPLLTQEEIRRLPKIFNEYLNQ